MEINQIINIVAKEFKLHSYEIEMIAYPHSTNKLRNALTLILKLCEIDEHNAENVRRALINKISIFSPQCYNYALERFYQLIDKNWAFTQQYNKCLEQYLALSN